MYSDIYKKVKARLVAKLPTVKDRDVQWYNGQYEQQPEIGKKPIFQCPALFIEFGAWEPGLGSIQAGDVDITVHVVTEYFDREQHIFDHEAKAKEVLKALQGFSCKDDLSRALLGSLRRRRTEPVHDLRRMLVTRMVFNGFAFDHSTEKTYTKRPTNPDIKKDS